MYTQHFGFTEEPFSIVPNPHYCYMSSGHRNALAHLFYGIKGKGGFIRLTGEVGTGKTTICRVLLELTPKDLEIAFILHPPATVEDLLATICDEFNIGYSSDTTSVKVFVARIHAYLLDVHNRSKSAVLIVEEAQNLSIEVLEQIRLLTNFETNDRKLLHIIIIGQPELRHKLRQPELRQFAQRITGRYHLGPLSRGDIPHYVNFRLTTAGLKRTGQLFPPRTVKKLHRLSGGVPRVINVICDRALRSVYAEGKFRVDVKTLKAAAHEVRDDGYGPSRIWAIYPKIAVAVFLLVCSVFAGNHYVWRAGPFASIMPSSSEAEERRVKADPAAVYLPAIEEVSDYSRLGTKESAYQALFKSWQAEFKADAGQSACEQAQKAALRCAHETAGSIDRLRETNRPAVLRLRDAEGGDYYVALIGLQGETATCVIGNETRFLSVSKIIKEWSGEYLLLWREPPDYREKLMPGTRGPLVGWLEKELALVQERAPRSGEAQLYDREMEKRVKEFQRSKGLKPDGIAGPGTITKLMATVVSAEPTLYSPALIKSRVE